MSQRLWSRGSASRAASRLLLLLCVLSSSLAVLAQTQFARDYTRGEEAFQRGDWAEAERLFLSSIKSADAPKERGASVNLVSQQYGYYPEYYLALIYAQQKRVKDMQTYSATAKKYIKRGDPMYLTLVNAENSVANATPTPTPDGSGGNRSVVVTPPDLTTATTNGPMYALVIGIDRYDDITFPTLQTAVRDARAVNDLLRDKYGFETTLLENATRREIISALDGYRRTADETSSLLIYYAGHGYYDKAADKASWLPRDAEQTVTVNWIKADEITSEIKAIPARHVIVVSDSCYSGGLSREGAADLAIADHTRYVQKAAVGKSRNLLSSGGNEPVSDAGGDAGHSVFASAFLKGLTQMEPNDFTALELFRDYIAVPVAGRSAQSPHYTPIQNSGHDDGDFVFRRKVAR